MILDCQYLIVVRGKSNSAPNHGNENKEKELRETFNTMAGVI